MIRSLIPLLGTLGMSACAYPVPAWTSGPARSAEGVTASIAGERCSQERAAPPENLIDVQMQVDILNGTASAVTIWPDYLRLACAGGVNMKPLPSNQAIHLAAGEHRRTSVRFAHRGHATCSSDLELEFANSVTVGDRPLEMTPIRFAAAKIPSSETGPVATSQTR